MFCLANITGHPHHLPFYEHFPFVSVAKPISYEQMDGKFHEKRLHSPDRQPCRVWDSVISSQAETAVLRLMEFMEKEAISKVLIGEEN